MAGRKRKEFPLPKRPSTLLPRGAIPIAIQQRQELERMLRVHDPDLVEKTRARIKPTQMPLIRRIALESPSSEDMVVRKHAIALLASRGTADDLNLLTELARFDAEPAIRAEAITGLARIGVEMAAPILLEALASRDLVESTAASKAVAALAQKVGSAPIRVHIDKASARAKKLGGAVLDGLSNTATKRRPKKRSRRDPQG
jgi:hypothetical protein